MDCFASLAMTKNPDTPSPRHAPEPLKNLPPKEGAANLTPASGRQDHTTSPYATSSLVRSLGDRSQAVKPALQSRRAKTLPRPPHPIPTFVTIMIRRSSRDGMARTCRDDLPDGESGIFFETGLDRQIADLPVGQISLAFD